MIDFKEFLKAHEPFVVRKDGVRYGEVLCESCAKNDKHALEYEDPVSIYTTKKYNNVSRPFYCNECECMLALPDTKLLGLSKRDAIKINKLVHDISLEDYCFKFSTFGVNWVDVYLRMLRENNSEVLMTAPIQTEDGIADEERKQLKLSLATVAKFAIAELLQNIPDKNDMNRVAPLCLERPAMSSLIPDDSPWNAIFKLRSYINKLNFNK